VGISHRETILAGFRPYYDLVIERPAESGPVLDTGVKVDGQEVYASTVVVAMGPWTKSAAAWFEGIPKIQAQKAHSIVMQPAGEVSADCLFLAHTNKQGAGCRPPSSMNKLDSHGCMFQGGSSALLLARCMCPELRTTRPA